MKHNDQENLTQDVASCVFTSAKIQSLDFLASVVLLGVFHCFQKNQHYDCCKAVNHQFECKYFQSFEPQDNK